MNVWMKTQRRDSENKAKHQETKEENLEEGEAISQGVTVTGAVSS